MMLLMPPSMNEIRNNRFEMSISNGYCNHIHITAPREETADGMEEAQALFDLIHPLGLRILTRPHIHHLWLMEENIHVEVEAGSFIDAVVEMQ